MRNLLGLAPLVQLIYVVLQVGHNAPCLPDLLHHDLPVDGVDGSGVVCEYKGGNPQVKTVKSGPRDTIVLGQPNYNYLSAVLDKFSEASVP